MEYRARVCASCRTDGFAHLDMSHPGDCAINLDDILPPRSRCTLCVCFSHSFAQICSQQHLLAAHDRGMYAAYEGSITQHVIG